MECVVICSHHSHHPPHLTPTDTLRGIISQALKDNKPSMISKLVLTKCELGNIPLRVEAIRVIQLNNNSDCIIFDLDVRWIR